MFEHDVIPYVKAEAEFTGERRLVLSVLEDARTILGKTPKTQLQRIEYLLTFEWFFGDSDPVDTWYLTFEQVSMFLQISMQWTRNNLLSEVIDPGVLKECLDKEQYAVSKMPALTRFLQRRGQA